VLRTKDSPPRYMDDLDEVEAPGKSGYRIADSGNA
jgi:hypothetical protein